MSAKPKRSNVRTTTAPDSQGAKVESTEQQLVRIPEPSRARESRLRSAGRTGVASTLAMGVCLVFTLGAECSDPPPVADGGPTPDAQSSDAQTSSDSQVAPDAETLTDSAIPTDAADGACANTSTDSQNCGACGYACLHGRTCSAGRCLPAWLPLSATNAPPGRDRHAAAGLGTKYVATGGTSTYQGVGMTSAVAYDLATDTWSTYASHVTQRCSHEIVSTGTKLLAFGGITDCLQGGSYGPGLEESVGGAWSTVSPANPPDGRYNFAMAWTGTELMLYGGSNGPPAVSTGARLTPGGDWVSAPCSLPGCERGGYFTLFRDGPVMRVMGGGPYGNAPAGLQYELATGTWSSWAIPSSYPDISAHMRHAEDGRRIYYVREGASCEAAPSLVIFDRQTGTWTTDTSTPPAGLIARGAAAWVAGELVVWSGDCGTGPSTTGGRYQPPAP
jgi:hypothetical protein